MPAGLDEAEQKASAALLHWEKVLVRMYDNAKRGLPR
jgi:hypothetical protein